MGDAADLGHAEFETGFVTTKIMADQFAPPVLQEVAYSPARLEATASR